MANPGIDSVVKGIGKRIANMRNLEIVDEAKYFDRVEEELCHLVMSRLMLADMKATEIVKDKTGEEEQKS